MGRIPQSLLALASISCLIQNAASDSNDTACSAILSYVHVISSGNISTVLTSAQALFPPYSYYLEHTELAKLDSDDDPCSSSGVSTAIEGKIVLLFESEGNCTNHHKVAVAESYGAVGVVLANNDLSGEVAAIADDNASATTIPLRSVTFFDGNALADELDSEIVEVEFGCFDSDYPTNLCALDSEGDAWRLDGSFQRQDDTFNDHPVYKKEGYVWIVEDLYVFLHDADGDSNWYWAITEDSALSNDDHIVAVCVDSDVSEPSGCSSWNLTDSQMAPGHYPYLNVSSGLCSVSDATLCMESSQSNLMGMGGTYRQFNDATPFWFRETTTCDTRPSWLLFHDGSFFVWDTFDDIDVAECRLDRQYYLNRSSWETAKFRPDLCSEWETLVNSAIGSVELQRDDSFHIFLGGECTDYSCTTTTAPDALCMSESGGAYGFLEGDYEKTESVGPIYGFPEYERTESIDYEGLAVPIYVWFYGETGTEMDAKWWVMSSSSLAEAVEANGSVGVYAFCEADVANPVDCAAGWRFFFVNGYPLDESFTLSPGECEVTSTNAPRQWPEFICIESPGGSDSSYLPSAYFEGGYRINTTGTAISGGVPHWVKPRNDAWDYHDIFLYLDAFYGWWQIGNEMHVFEYVNLLCFNSDGYSPLDCELWHDLKLDPMPTLNLYECTEDDMIPLTEADGMGGDGERGSTTAVVVLVVLFAIGICLGLIWWFKCRRDRDLERWNKPRKLGSPNEVASPADTAGHIEMDQPFSQQDHRKMSGHTKVNTHTGTFDMSPLNVNAPTDHLDPSIGDDHDHDDGDYASDGDNATGDVLE